MTTNPVHIPVIETERLILRAPRLDDLDRFMTIYTDPDHARFVSRVADPGKAFDKLSSLIGHWQLRGWGRFAVEEKSSGRFIGHCGASQLDDAHEPELNYSFTPDSGGKGYASEAVIRTLIYLYNEQGWQTAISEIHPDNVRSRALAQRLGAVLDGHKDRGAFGILDIWRYPPPSVFTRRQGHAA